MNESEFTEGTKTAHLGHLNEVGAIEICGEITTARNLFLIREIYQNIKTVTERIIPQI